MLAMEKCAHEKRKGIRMSSGMEKKSLQTLVPQYKILSDSLLVLLARKMVKKFKWEKSIRKFMEKMLVKACGSSGNIVHMVLDSGCRFEFPAKDRVWRRFVSRNRYSFEADLYYVLDSFRGMSCSFFDVGSNYGYWSVIALHMGWKNVTAVEASSSNFFWLHRNARLNGEQIIALHRAIYSRDGQKVGFSGEAEHDQRHITTQQKAAEFVETITLDTLVSRYAPEGPVVIKLDVEGAEILALQGARELLLHRDVLLAYEDLPRDASHAPSRFILQHPDWRVYAIVHERDDIMKHDMKLYRARNIDDVERLKELKFSKNFYATSSRSSFHESLDRMALNI